MKIMRFTQLRVLSNPNVVLVQNLLSIGPSSKVQVLHFYFQLYLIFASCKRGGGGGGSVAVRILSKNGLEYHIAKILGYLLNKALVTVDLLS